MGQEENATIKAEEDERGTSRDGITPQHLDNAGGSAAARAESGTQAGTSLREHAKAHPDAEGKGDDNGEGTNETPGAARGIGGTQRCRIDGNRPGWAEAGSFDVAGSVFAGMHGGGQ